MNGLEKSFSHLYTESQRHHSFQLYNFHHHYIGPQYSYYCIHQYILTKNLHFYNYQLEGHH